jgi:hypothetical protein
MFVQPDFCTPDTWRAWVKNNQDIECVLIAIETEDTWLPKVLSEHGFFVSNSQVKKNRPDLWRDLVPDETITLGWCEISLTQPA